MVDRRNHHLFQPLLYQVATASLAPSEIAWPIRTLLRKRPEVATLLASVEAIDKEARRVRLDDGSTLRYDTLVLATGARHAYFGHDDWEPLVPGLKTLEDATTIRGRILLAFERAEREPDEQKRAALMTSSAPARPASSSPARSPSWREPRCPRTSAPSIRERRGSC